MRRGHSAGALLALLATGCAAEVMESREAVVDGRLATSADIRGTVAVRWTTSAFSGSGCTGTVVTPRVVVTAAHCVAETTADDPLTLVRVASPEEVLVLSGRLDVTDATQADTYTVSRVEIHPEYPGLRSLHDTVDATGIGQHDDIAVLVLNFGVRLEAIRVLPPERVDEELVAGRALEIAGYGVGAPPGSSELTEGVLHVGETFYESRQEYELLTGGGADTCWGDSGGPTYLVANDGVFLVGVTSRARLDMPDCGGGSIMSLAPAYLPWLDAVAGVSGGPSTATSCAIAPSTPAKGSWIGAVVVALASLLRVRRAARHAR